MFQKTIFITLLTFVSRVLGVIRDAVIAVCFGISVQTDAFFIAFRPFDLARKLFSEGILSLSMVPGISRTLEKEGRNKTLVIVWSFFFFFSLAGVLLVLLGFLSAPFLMPFLAPGFGRETYAYGLTLTLLSFMLPYIGLICISAVCMGVLNAFGHFGAPSVTPLIFNLVIILSAIVASSYLAIPVIGLAAGVLAGGILQVGIQVIVLIRLGLLPLSRFPTHLKKFHPAVIRAGKFMVPSMIGAASYQINIMAASCFASRLDQGSVSFVYFADRLVQFPLALFAVSMAMVLLPEISRQAALGRMHEVSEQFSRGVRMVFFVTIPAMSGLMALDVPIVSVLFGYGAFDDPAVQQTADCLFFLASGLWAFTGMRLLATLFYGLNHPRLPFWAGMTAILTNMGLAPLLSVLWGLKGIMLSVSLSSGVGLLFLMTHVPGGLIIHKKRILVSACRSFLISAIMFIPVKLSAELLLPVLTEKYLFAAGVAGSIGGGVLIYLGIHLLVSNPELGWFRVLLKRNVS